MRCGPTLEAMRRTGLIALVAVVVVGLVCVEAVLGSSTPSPTITVRLMQSIQGSDSITLQFEITNHTATRCMLDPFRQLQVYRDSEWKPCFEDHSRSLTITLRPHEVGHFACVATEIPKGLPLRLRIFPALELPRLKGAVTRLEFSLKTHDADWNPFNTNAVFKSFEVVSEVFTVGPVPESARSKPTAATAGSK